MCVCVFEKFMLNMNVMSVRVCVCMCVFEKFMLNMSLCVCVQ